MISWFLYVRHADAAALTETKLWAVIADLGPTHGAYSVLMQWCGEGEPSALPMAAE
jgi:hypothetical protein